MNRPEMFWLEKFSNFTPKIKFKWRDQYGDFHTLESMETKHLFYTWLMIWNHYAPPDMCIWYKRSYSFPEFYTTKYMIEAFKKMHKELKTRTDLGYKMKKVLAANEENLYNYIKNNKK